MLSVDLQALTNLHTSVACAFRTDGKGNLEGFQSSSLRQTLGLELDVVLSTLESLGQRNFGSLRVVMLSFGRATVVLGKINKTQGCVGVVASSRQGLGLLLSRIEQLATEKGKLEN